MLLIFWTVGEIVGLRVDLDPSRHPLPPWREVPRCTGGVTGSCVRPGRTVNRRDRDMRSRSKKEARRVTVSRAT